MASVTILGGGNTGFACAAHLALRGFEVTLGEISDFAWTLAPVQQSRTIRLEGVAGQGAARVARLTTDMGEALGHSDLILLMVPAYAHRAFAEACAPHLRRGQILLLTPGTLG